MTFRVETDLLNSIKKGESLVDSFSSTIATELKEKTNFSNPFYKRDTSQKGSKLISSVIAIALVLMIFLAGPASAAYLATWTNPVQDEIFDNGGYVDVHIDLAKDGLDTTNTVDLQVQYNDGNSTSTIGTFSGICTPAYISENYGYGYGYGYELGLTGPNMDDLVYDTPSTTQDLDVETTPSQETNTPTGLFGFMGLGDSELIPIVLLVLAVIIIGYYFYKNKKKK